MKQKEKLKIYSIHYKSDNQIVLNDQNYINVWAGKNDSVNKTVLVGDDSGDNISAKNKYYSELTGLYWVWKNTNQEITGCCHYRRFFTANAEPFHYKLKRNLYYLAGIWKKRYGLIYTSNLDKWRSQILSADEIISILKDYEAIMPVRRKLKCSVVEHYDRYHDINDLMLIKEILKKDYPKYLASFDKTMNKKRLFANNMFILNHERFFPNFREE